MFVCAACKHMCHEFCAQKERKKEKKKKKDFCEKHKAQGGGYGHREKREHQALLLFSALGRVSSPAVSHRSVE